MKKICANPNCKKEFECYDKAGVGRRGRGSKKRQSNAKTCSPKCSKIYNSVSNKIARIRIKNDKKKE